MSRSVAAPRLSVDRPSRKKVQEWADAVLGMGMGMGIKSVLCILHYTQLAHYDYDRMNLRGGSLFGYYWSLGLKVEHVYAEDHKIPPLSVEEVGAALPAFHRLERPVLIHRSAGKDHTGAAVICILSQLPVVGG